MPSNNGWVSTHWVLKSVVRHPIDPERPRRWATRQHAVVRCKYVPGVPPGIHPVDLDHGEQGPSARVPGVSDYDSVETACREMITLRGLVFVTRSKLAD